MGNEQFPEKSEESPEAKPSDEFLVELAQMVNDGTLKREIDEATGYDPDLAV